jgi:hypothetical protein
MVTAYVADHSTKLEMKLSGWDCHQTTLHAFKIQ